MVTTFKKILLSTVATGALFATTLSAEEEMVKSIMKLRAEVETLYTKIDDNRDSYKAQMKSYALQFSDNEAQINRQETALKLTEQNIEKTMNELKVLGSGSKDIKPIINKALLNLAKVIESGIPFKVEERLDALKKIKSDLENNVITQEKALALTWANYDDTLRITKEIGLFKEEITLEGEAKLAKIAKVGSVMMFFSTLDDSVGYVKKEGSSYKYVVVTDDTARAEIVHLFDALQKQIRTGYFTLPNALLVGAK